MTRQHRCRAIACALMSVGRSCLAADRVDRAVSVNATAGVTFVGEPARIALLETRAEATSHVTIAAALAYVEGVAGYHEMQLRLLATGTIEVERWVIENRHMISLSSESVERYRSRLRVMRPGLLGHPGLSARAFDEVFLDLDRGRLIRNNLALGVGAQIKRCTAELYHVWVDNHDAPSSNFLLALVTVRIRR